jgi:hypothetical protein
MLLVIGRGMQAKKFLMANSWAPSAIANRQISQLCQSAIANLHFTDPQIT